MTNARQNDQSATEKNEEARSEIHLKSISLSNTDEFSTDEFQSLCDFIESANLEEIKFCTQEVMLNRAIMEDLFTAIAKSSVKQITFSSQAKRALYRTPYFFKALCTTQNQVGTCLFDLIESAAQKSLLEIFSKDTGSGWPSTMILEVFKLFIHSSSKHKALATHLSLPFLPLQNILDLEAACDAITKSSLRSISLSGLFGYAQDVNVFKIFFAALSSSPIKEFNFDSNSLVSNLNDGEFATFCEFISSLQGTSLSLSNCNIGQLTSDRSKLLYSSLAKSNFSGLSFGDISLCINLIRPESRENTFEALCNVISNPHLQQLNLINTLPDRVGDIHEKIFNALANTKIQRLQLFCIDQILSFETDKNLISAIELFVSAFRSNFYLLQLETLIPGDSAYSDSILYRIAPELETIINRNKNIASLKNILTRLNNILEGSDWAQKGKDLSKAYFDSQLSTIDECLGKIPTDSTNYFDSLSAEKYRFLFNLGCRHLYFEYEIDPLEYWQQIPTTSAYFNRARFEAFQYAYNRFYENKAKHLYAFIHALPLCFDEDGRLIKFDNEPNQTCFDRNLLPAVSTARNDGLIKDLTPELRLVLIKFAFILFFNEYKPYRVLVAPPLEIALLALNPLKDVVLPDNFDQLWLMVSRAAHTLPMGNDVKFIINSLYDPFSDSKTVKKTLENNTLDEKAFNFLYEYHFHSQDEKQIVADLELKTRQNVKRFFSLAESFLRKKAAGLIKDMKTLYQQNQSRAMWAEELLKTEKILLHLKKINNLYRGVKAHDRGANLLKSILHEINLYFKKRAAETPRFSLIAWFFGYSGKEYYAQRDHFQSLLDLFANAERRDPQSFVVISNKIAEGLMAFSQVSSKRYADLLIKLRKCINDQYTSNSTPRLPYHLIVSSLDNYKKQQTATKACKKFETASDRKVKAQSYARFKQGLFDYRILTLDREDFLSAKELKETELRNVWSA